MGWYANDNINKERRSVGRPDDNPFPSKEVEEDFVVRCRKMIESWYVHDPKSKLNFRFPQDRNMSKTNFWSIIYIYYLVEKGLTKNLQGFLDIVNEKVGRDYLSDRGAIAKRVKMLESLFVTHTKTESELTSEADKKAQNKHRTRYQYVVNLFSGIEIEQGTVPGI